MSLRVWLPESVAAWLGDQAELRYESRSEFVRHLIVALYLHSTGRA